MAQRYFIRVCGYDDKGQRIPWEDVDATSLVCSETQISMYASLRSQETGCEVRINKAGSHQGHYYRAELAKDTRKVMNAAFGPTSKPTDNNGL